MSGVRLLAYKSVILHRERRKAECQSRKNKNKKEDSMEICEFNDWYNRGYNDALRWVINHTDGDNYKKQVKSRLEKGE